MPTSHENEREVKVSEQSTKLQVESQINNENGITQSKTKTTSGGKRKSFSNKRRKKKKRKQPQKQEQQQREEEVRGVKNENLSRYDKEDSVGRSNYETVSNVSMTTTSSLKTARRNCE